MRTWEKKYLKKASKSFISSTFWTEKSGLVAALATINIMKKEKTYKKVINIGKKIKNIWKKKSEKYKIPIDIYGLDSIPCFRILTKNSNKYKTLFTQEMLKSKILATNQIYVSIVHNDKLLKKYEIVLEKIFHKIKQCEDIKLYT